MTELIFMLTHHDVTIPNALDVFEDVKNTGLKFVGCKDIGLPMDRLRNLFHKMRKAEMTTFLEVVSNQREEHFTGVNKAMELKVDYLIGGMPQFTADTMEYLRKEGATVKFFPYIGRVVEHPCVLEGSIDDIVKNGVEVEKLGIEGINLLLYRYKGDTNLLLDKIVSTLNLRLVVAGSIDNFAKIEYLRKKKVWAFTIGGAIFENRFSKEQNVKAQIVSVLKHLV